MQLECIRRIMAMLNLGNAYRKLYDQPLTNNHNSNIYGTDSIDDILILIGYLNEKKLTFANSDMEFNCLVDDKSAYITNSSGYLECTSSEASINLLKTPELTMECSFALQYYLYSLAEETLGPSIFDDIRIIMSGHALTNPSLRRIYNILPQSVTSIQRGTIVYIRGCAYFYHMLLNNIDYPKGFRMSFQGENAIYLGDNLYLTYFRCENNTAKYSISTYSEICETLRARGQCEFHEKLSLAASKRIKKEFKKIKLNGKSLIYDLFDVIGTESAHSISFK